MDSPESIPGKAPYPGTKDMPQWDLDELKDAPVVTWFHEAMPEKIAYDPLGVFADRRVTESFRGHDPMKALQQRAVDYAPGDTDLS